MDVQVDVNGRNFVQQRVSLKWLNQTSDSLTHTSDDVCNGNSPKSILNRVLDFSSDGSDIILTTEEDNRLYPIANRSFSRDVITFQNLKLRIHQNVYPHQA